MGEWLPPVYGKEDAVKIIKEIADLDKKINELLIKREEYVEALEEAIK